MAREYDLEDLLFEMDGFLKQKLNPIIREINSEKSDNIKLEEFGENAFYVQSLDDTVANQSQYLLLEAVDIQADGSGPGTFENYSILALIIAPTINNRQQVRKMFRYGKALKRVFRRDWATSNKLNVKFKIQSIPPQDYQNLNSTKQFKAVSIVLEGGFA